MRAQPPQTTGSRLHPIRSETWLRRYPIPSHHPGTQQEPRALRLLHSWAAVAPLRPMRRMLKARWKRRVGVSDGILPVWNCIQSSCPLQLRSAQSGSSQLRIFVEHSSSKIDVDKQKIFKVSSSTLG